MGKTKGSKRQLETGTWELCVQHGYRRDGKPRRVYKYIDGDERDAELALDALCYKMGVSPNMGDTMTVDQYWSLYFDEDRSALVCNSTMQRYRSLYAKHIKPVFGSIPADAIKSGDVQRWVLRMSPATARKSLALLKMILTDMYDGEFLDKKPLDRRIKLPRQQREIQHPWTAAEIMEAMDRLRGTQMEALFLVMVGGGLRREEAIALVAPDDFSFESVTGIDGREHVVCRVMINKTLTELDGHQDHTKTYNARPVTISDPFAARLREILAGLTESRQLMVRQDGNPISVSSIPETWRRLFGPNKPLDGMRYVQLRTMRHAHETLASLAGVSDSINSAMHGHSQQVSYSHYLEHGERGADSVAEAIRLSIAR